jgi:hypothetical protein
LKATGLDKMKRSFAVHFRTDKGKNKLIGKSLAVHFSELLKENINDDWAQLFRS